MKKKRIVPYIFAIFSVMSIILLSFDCMAGTYYKDITSINIKTNFNDLDYETIQDSGLPDIEISDSADGGYSNGCNIYTSSSKYYIESAEWYDNDFDEFSVGGQPRIICYLTTKDYPNNSSSDKEYYYRFMSSYSTSTCYISGGTLVSAQRVSSDNLKVVFKLKNLKGTYNQPEDPVWADDVGTAEWNAPIINDSGYYDIMLYRDESLVAHIYKNKGNRYNFYSYMTKPGEYIYKVRTVAGDDTGNTYGKNSEYIESTPHIVTEDNMYDPAKGVGNYYGNTGATNPMQVGWIQTGNKWYFVRPDGVMAKSTWVQWNGKWYYLGDDGMMKTGWIDVNGKEYYLQTDGAMITGWLSSSTTYFYFDTTQGDHYGAMCKNMFVNYQGKYFYFDESGVMVTGWRQIKDSSGNTAFYYFYPNGEVQGLFGYMATNTVINGFYVGSDGKWVQSSR